MSKCNSVALRRLVTCAPLHTGFVYLHHHHHRWHIAYSCSNRIRIPVQTGLQNPANMQLVILTCYPCLLFGLHILCWCHMHQNVSICSSKGYIARCVGPMIPTAIAAAHGFQALKAYCIQPALNCRNGLGQHGVDAELSQVCHPRKLVTKLQT